VVTATIRRAKTVATFVFLEDRELAHLNELVVHENGEQMIAVPWMEHHVPFRAILRGHAIDVETGCAPDGVDPFDRAMDRWPSCEAAWIHVEGWARYFLDHLLRWRETHDGRRAPTGFTLSAIRRLAIAAGHDPADRDLQRLVATLDRLAAANAAGLTTPHR
jgi:hypothetical protein